jgi:peptidoglycan pentaglycine glycine transferase (the first glycine)
VREPDPVGGHTVHGDAGYRLCVSAEPRDPGWDRFLCATPGGHHLQSSLWGQVKSRLGWRAVRVTAVAEGRIRGGMQILLRRFPVVGPVGSVGYVALGPLVDRDDPALHELLLGGLHRVSREHRVVFLVVQPSAQQDSIVGRLRADGFREAIGPVQPHPTATLLVDLSRDEQSLLAEMRKATRYNVRRAERIGVRIREGGDCDIETFHRLLTMTARRQRFSVPPEQYFRGLLRVMAPGGHAKVFLAEFDGEPLAGALVIAFGDRVSLKRAAWSGEHRHLHPNELLQWSVMRWAKGQGYRYYDFEGIDLPATTADGVRIDAAAAGSVSAFKAGFGGVVALSPGAYQQIPHPLLRRANDSVVPRLLGSAAGRWVVEAIRTR